MSPDARRLWIIAVAWSFPILAWMAWLAGSFSYAESRKEAIREAALEPAENLQACLDFALTNFTTPDPRKRAACERSYEREMGALPGKRRALGSQVNRGYGSAAAAVLLGVAYFAFVPRRLRATWRAAVVSIVLGVVIGGAYWLLAAHAMPRLGFRDRPPGAVSILGDPARTAGTGRPGRSSLARRAAVLSSGRFQMHWPLLHVVPFGHLTPQVPQLF